MKKTAPFRKRPLSQLITLNSLSGSSQPANPARTADAESAAVADDVRATVSDAGQLLSTQRCVAEWVLRRRKACALRVNRRAKRQPAAGKHQRICRILTGKRRAVGASRTGECRAGARGDNLYDHGVRPHAGQRIGNQILVHRKRG